MTYSFPYLEPGVFSERCREKLPLRVDCIHRREFVTGIFFILLWTLHPCIAVTENIGLANKMLWKNPNFWPTQYISLKTLNLGREAFHWAHSATTFPSDHKEGQLRRPSWTSANICILASLLLQPFDPRRFLYQYCAVLSYSVVSESLRPHGL